MDLEDRGLDSAALIGIILQGLLTGFQLVLYIQCIWKTRARAYDLAIVISVLSLLLVFTISHFVFSLSEVYQAFYVHRVTPGVVEWLKRPFNYATPSRDIIYYFSATFAASLMTWRLYYVWLESFWACCLPVLSIFLCVGFASIDIVCEFLKASSMDGHYKGMEIPWEGVALSANLFMVTAITTMIAGRHWWTSRSSRIKGKGRRDWALLLKRMFFVGIDSGSLSPASLILVAFCYAAALPNVLWAATFVLPPVTGLVPTMMILGLDFSGDNRWRDPHVHPERPTASTPARHPSQSRKESGYA